MDLERVLCWSGERTVGEIEEDEVDESIGDLNKLNPH